MVGAREKVGEIELSVIVVSWNTRGLLAKCLASIAPTLKPHLPELESHLPTSNSEHPTSNTDLRTSHVEPRSSDLELLVVDNASSDGSSEMVRAQFPSVWLIENQENVGFAAANNQAIRRAHGRYVVLLNSDAELRRGALEALVAFMEVHPRAGAAGARLLNADGSLQPSCHPLPTPEREFWRLLFLEPVWPRATYPMGRWDTTAPRRVEAIKGACLILRRAALDRVGLLDEDYFMYTEEVDLCYRLAQAGWELWWVPQAMVTHYEGQSTRQAAERMFVQLYRSKVHFFRKFGETGQADRFKRFLRLAYWPRLVAASLGAPFSGSLATQAQTYRRLLAELPGM
jgi:GT2 family glycosyltransferase